MTGGSHVKENVGCDRKAITLSGSLFPNPRLRDNAHRNRYLISAGHIQWTALNHKNEQKN